jgi:hypothetical protein
LNGHPSLCLLLKQAVSFFLRQLLWFENYNKFLERPRLGPDSQRSLRALLLEDDLPVLVAQGNEVAVVVEVDELLARAALLLACEVRKLIIAVEMDREGLASGLVALEQLVLNVGIARGRHESRQPIEAAD